MYEYPSRCVEWMVSRNMKEAIGGKLTFFVTRSEDVVGGKTQPGGQH